VGQNGLLVLALIGIMLFSAAFGAYSNLNQMPSAPRVPIRIISTGYSSGVIPKQEENKTLTIQEEQSNMSLHLHTAGTKIFNALGEEVIWNGVTTMTLYKYEVYGHNVIYTPDKLDRIRN
jgi:hypothetical protein